MFYRYFYRALSMEYFPLVISLLFVNFLIMNPTTPINVTNSYENRLHTASGSLAFWRHVTPTPVKVDDLSWC